VNDRTDAESPRNGQRLVAFYDTKRVKAGDNAGVEQLPVSRASDFELARAAVTRVVYVTHPGSERRLIPFADYDEELARDRLIEALRVFTALGASRVVATSTRSDTSDRMLHGKVPLARFNLAQRRRSSSTVEVDQRGSGGPAIDPRPLKYPEEPGLDSACEAVLRLGGRHCTIKIERSTQYGIDGELGVRLKKAGFRLGASGTRTQTSVFVIDAVFGREAIKELDPVVDAVSSDGTKSDSPSRWRRRKA